MSVHGAVLGVAGLIMFDYFMLAFVGTGFAALAAGGPAPNAKRGALESVVCCYRVARINAHILQAARHLCGRSHLVYTSTTPAAYVAPSVEGATAGRPPVLRRHRSCRGQGHRGEEWLLPRRHSASHSIHVMTATELHARLGGTLHRLSAASWALHVARWRPSTPQRFDAEWDLHPAERRTCSF